MQLVSLLVNKKLDTALGLLNERLLLADAPEVKLVFAADRR